MLETVNQRIFHIRKLKGYTQADMARTLNMKLSTYSQAERKGKISTELVVKIADVLEVDVGYLLTGKHSKEEKPIPATPVLPPEPPAPPKTDGNEELKKLLSAIGLTDGILTALFNIPNNKRIAIYKLILLSLNNKKFDIIGEVDRIEASLKSEKDL